jgi:hypothetical protein
MCTFNIKKYAKAKFNPQNKILIHYILKQKEKIAKNITYARGINLVQTAILAHASCARFLF